MHDDPLALLPIIAVAFIVSHQLLQAEQAKYLRQFLELTQQELADKVGVSRQSINSIECNRYVPSLPLALLFSKAFGHPTDEIFKLERSK